MFIFTDKFQLFLRQMFSFDKKRTHSMNMFNYQGRHHIAPLKANNHHGKVYIIGAGPGDAELLTLKAIRLMNQADIVLFDALVSTDVLATIPRHVKREYVGKRCGKHSMTQNEISERVVELAHAGHSVVRLKGGDPALFARTCEETKALTMAKIPFAIVPGITAASGVSAYTGIPLTDRSCAQAVMFMTAHFQNPEQWPDVEQLAKNVSNHTVVVYMGLSRLATLCEQLRQCGVDSHWPIAVVENATCVNQRMVVGTLDSIGALVNDSDISGPTLLIFGKVVESRQLIDSALLYQNQYARAI